MKLGNSAESVGRDERSSRGVLPDFALDSRASTHRPNNGCPEFADGEAGGGVFPPRPLDDVGGEYGNQAIARRHASGLASSRLEAESRANCPIMHPAMVGVCDWTPCGGRLLRTPASSRRRKGSPYLRLCARVPHGGVWGPLHGRRRRLCLLGRWPVQ